MSFHGNTFPTGKGYALIFSFDNFPPFRADVATGLVQPDATHIAVYRVLIDVIIFALAYFETFAAFNLIRNG